MSHISAPIIGKEFCRPWGLYRSLNYRNIAKDLKNPQEYDVSQTKFIYVKPGEALSTQSHRDRCEHWIIIQGNGVVTVKDIKRKFGPNSHIFIPRGAIHKLENQETEPLALIEVQLGVSVDENDIIRYADKYGRETLIHS